MDSLTNKDADVDQLEELAAPKDRATERLEYRAKHGADYCFKCNAPLSAVDMLDYVCNSCDQGD